MFGMRVKPKGLFGSGQGIVATPEQEAESARLAKQFGLGGVDEAEPSPVQGAFGIGGKIMPGTQAAKRGGVFGSGVPWGDVLYALGGAIAGDGGAAVQQVQQRKLAPLMEQAKRENEYRDWVRKQQWERENPAPKDPYRWRNNNGDLMEMGADGQPRVAYDDPTDKMDWIQVRDPLTGEIRIIPQPRGQQSAPDVLPADFFDDGGPSQPATGRFP